MFVFPAPYTVSPPVLTGAHVVSGDDLATLSIGAEPSGSERRFIAVVGTVVGSNPTLGGSPTIGGVAAAQVVSTIAGNEASNIFWVEVASGTTAAIDMDIATGGGAGLDRVHIYRLIVSNSGGLTVTAFDDDDDLVSTLSFSIDIAAGGFVIGGAIGTNCGSWTWTGLDEDDDTDLLTNENSTAASRAYASAQTGQAITAVCVLNSTDINGVVASFAPTAS
jgi:hypothetical protein